MQHSARYARAMSHQNVELVQQMINAWNRGDYDTARDFFDPEVEVEAALGADIDGTYFGHAGLAKLMRRSCVTDSSRPKPKPSKPPGCRSSHK
jgi:ketosteroid isomerase-like protein